MVERPQDPPTRGDQERVVAAPDDKHGALGTHHDPQRVRECPVISEGVHIGQRREPAVEVAAIDAKQAPVQVGRERGAHLGADRRRPAGNDEFLYGENTRISGTEVRGDRKHEKADAEEDRPARRREPRQLWHRTARGQHGGTRL